MSESLSTHPSIHSATDPNAQNGTLPHEKGVGSKLDASASTTSRWKNGTIVPFRASGCRPGAPGALTRRLRILNLNLKPKRPFRPVSAGLGEFGFPRKKFFRDPASCLKSDRFRVIPT